MAHVSGPCKKPSPQAKPFCFATTKVNKRLVDNTSPSSLVFGNPHVNNAKLFF